MKKAHIDISGNILGWYDTEFHDNIPSPSIDASEYEWKNAIEISANTLENGKFIYKDKRSKEEKDKNVEDAEWEEYLNKEAESKRSSWKQLGKPKYKA